MNEYLDVYERHRKVLHGRLSIKGRMPTSEQFIQPGKYPSVLSGGQILQAFEFLHYKNTPENMFQRASVTLQGAVTPTNTSSQVLCLLKQHSGSGG